MSGLADQTCDCGCCGVKLAIVRQKYNPFGGAERFVERALNALRKQGVAVTLLTRHWRETEPATGNDAVLVLNPFYIGRLWRDAGFAKAVQRQIAAGRFDLVQSHERIPSCHIYRAGDGVHATWLALRGRQQSLLGRFFSACHPWHRYTLRAERQMFQHPDLRAIICNSRMVKDDIAARFPGAASKLYVIHNGVDLTLFNLDLRQTFRQQQRESWGIPQDAPVVLYVGSGFARKGVPQLLQALAKTRGIYLVVVGKDKKMAASLRAASRLGLAERVRFMGGVADVRPCYAAADVFALPTVYDPFPNAVLEALASGLPVLTSPTSGAAELINDACGVVVDALDVAGQAAALIRLCQANQHGEMRLAAHAAAKQCALDDMTDRLIALYTQLDTQ